MSSSRLWFAGAVMLFAGSVTACRGLLAFDDATSGSDGGDAAPTEGPSDAASAADGAHPAGDGGAQSCAPGGAGLTSCGEDGTESCCTSLGVTGGLYYWPFTDDGGGPTDLGAPVTVSDFRLDKYEVTVGRFRQFVAAWNHGAGWTPPAGSGKHTHLNGGAGLVARQGSPYESGWNPNDNGKVSPTDENLTANCNDPSYATWNAGNESRPINCVTRYEAYAFCIWDGGFLPSEAEWARAATGGNRREYPWGATPPGTSNQFAIYGCYFTGGTCSGAGSIAPVGTATQGAGRWGQLDLAGNVWEWTLDNYAPAGPCIDCVGLAVGSNGVARGGSFHYDASYLVTTYRSSNLTDYRDYDVGFRCARSP